MNRAHDSDVSEAQVTIYKMGLAARRKFHASVRVRSASMPAVLGKHTVESFRMKTRRTRKRVDDEDNDGGNDDGGGRHDSRRGRGRTATDSAAAINDDGGFGDRPSQAADVMTTIADGYSSESSGDGAGGASSGSSCDDFLPLQAPYLPSARSSSSVVSAPGLPSDLDDSATLPGASTSGEAANPVSVAVGDVETAVGDVEVEEGDPPLIPNTVLLAGDLVKSSALAVCAVCVRDRVSSIAFTPCAR